jgi:hypothetical protein
MFGARVRFASALIAGLTLFAADALSEPTTRADDQLTRYPHRGIALRSPAGFVEVPSDKAKTVVMWVGFGLDRQANRMVTVETAPATKNETASVAAALAKSWGGMVSGDKTSLDGETALRVVGPKSQGKQLSPTDAIVTKHSTQIYLIMGGSSADATASREVEDVRASWKWIELKSPSTQLDVTKTFQVGDQLRFSAPALMYKFEERPDRLGLSVLNIIRGANDLDFLIQTGIDALDGVDGVVERLSKGFPEKVKLREPLVWKKVGDRDDYRMTQFVRAEKAAGQNESPIGFVWGVARINNKIALITVTVQATDETDVKAYMAAIERMIGSIRPNHP